MLNFFCQIVEEVIAKSAIIVDINPNKGTPDPISKPKTNTAPKKPNKTPNHCLKVIFSPNNGPLNRLVNTGWRVTISAAIPVGIPIEIEKKTPPK